MRLSDYQVLQRGPCDIARVTLDSGETVELPVGGPYEVGGAKNILVGDLWILAGQSNMEGSADLVDVETPHPLVHSFQSREEWAPAEEPLHWLSESPREVHHSIWGLLMPRSIPPRDPNRTKGAGLALTFAKHVVEATGVPIGLIPAAHGGTSMQQWSPALRDRGGKSLYGATVKRFQEVGGKVAGILWYQGESDANPSEAPPYEERMIALINAFRADFSQPDLPFYYVQIGGWVNDPTLGIVNGWNHVREVQRRLPDRFPNIEMVSAIDLGLDDGIHIDTAGLKILGKRLAAVTLGQKAPALKSVAYEAKDGLLRVSFDNIQGSLQAAGRPTGFSLRDSRGDELPIIYKVTLEDTDALLKLTDSVRMLGARLWYGYGLAPYVNLTDSSGAAIPAFGPILIS